MGAAIATPLAGYALAPVASEARFEPVELGPIERFRTERGFAPTAVPYVEDPAQPLVSRGLAYVHHTGGRSGDWLAPDAMFVVFSNRCTHVGCPAQATGIGFACPCHGSQFDRNGARSAGPAVRPLDRLQWEIRSGETLWATRLWSVLIDGRHVRYFPPKPPGEPLAGQLPGATADLLYPPLLLRQGAPPASG
jgi:Rieske Fe-S protein